MKEYRKLTEQQILSEIRNPNLAHLSLFQLADYLQVRRIDVSTAQHNHLKKILKRDNPLWNLKYFGRMEVSVEKTRAKQKKTRNDKRKN